MNYQKIRNNQQEIIGYYEYSWDNPEDPRFNVYDNSHELINNGVSCLQLNKEKTWNLSDIEKFCKETLSK